VNARDILQPLDGFVLRLERGCDLPEVLGGPPESAGRSPESLFGLPEALFDLTKTPFTSITVLKKNNLM